MFEITEELIEPNPAAPQVEALLGCTHTAEFLTSLAMSIFFAQPLGPQLLGL